jgi:enoyl-CoA hydratase/carnithine racemase
MAKVSLEDNGQVALLRLTNGVTHAIGPELVEELALALPEVHGRFRGMVLAGGDKFFSIGLDVPALLKLSRKDMAAFWSGFEDAVLALYTLPLPTAAAIAGHANGGGAILALACDFRFIAAGRKLISLNEIQIGLPVPYLADMMLRQIAGDRAATRMEYLGAFLMPEEAQAAGVVDGVCPEAEVEARALAHIEAVASLPPSGFPLTKQHRVKDVRAQFLAGRESINQAFMDCWFMPSTQALLKEAATKF